MLRRGELVLLSGPSLWPFFLAMSAGGSMLLALVFPVGLGVILRDNFLLDPVLDPFPGS